MLYTSRVSLLVGIYNVILSHLFRLPLNWFSFFLSHIPSSLSSIFLPLTICVLIQITIISVIIVMNLVIILFIFFFFFSLIICVPFFCCFVDKIVEECVLFHVQYLIAIKKVLSVYILLSNRMFVSLYTKIW